VQRPAVSIRTTSTPRFAPGRSSRRRRPPGPSPPRQSRSHSRRWPSLRAALEAQALNVSAAPSSTLRPSSFCSAGDFFDRGRLAGCRWTPTMRITVGSWRMSMRPSPTCAVSRSRGDQPLAQGLPALDLPLPPLRSRACPRPTRRARADVGHDQSLLQAFPGVLVEHSDSVGLDLDRAPGGSSAMLSRRAPEEAFARLPSSAARNSSPNRSALAVMNRSLQFAGHGRRDDSSTVSPPSVFRRAQATLAGQMFRYGGRVRPWLFLSRLHRADRENAPRRFSTRARWPPPEIHVVRSSHEKTGSSKH